MKTFLLDWSMRWHYLGMTWIPYTQKDYPATRTATFGKLLKWLRDS